MGKRSFFDHSVIFVSVFLCMFILSAPCAFGEDIKAGQIGCNAPKLSGLEWVKGDAVEMKEGSIYVIEFWATWCGPCIAGIPHLTELQQKHKDDNVTIISISSETIDKVKPFVEEKGKEMGYTVAIDAGKKMSEAYMKAFGQGGIPHAFIVDKNGKIAWHGHPMSMDESLEKIIAGTFDVAEFAKQQAEAKKEKERRQLELKKEREEFEKKLVEMATAIEKDPGNIELLMERIQAYLGDSFSTELSYSPKYLALALEDYKKVMELDPENKNNAAEHIDFFEAWQDRTDERGPRLKAFAEKYPDSIRAPFALYSLFYYASDKGDLEQALVYITKADNAKLDSRFGEYFTKAKADLEKKIEEQKNKSKKTEPTAIGSVAPKLTGLQWVKGDAVEIKEGSVYVIEFWATWCGPCIAGIPHLTELQHSYKDKKVTVIGISGEKIDAVKPFVEKRGDQMSYTVAVDTTGDINKAYMKAFGQSGIPHAFIVDQKGQIAWHGHPMEMDDILEQVAAGDFDGIAHEKQKAGETAKAEQDYKGNLAALEKKLADNENDVDSLIAYGFLLIQERKSIPYAHKTFLKAIELDPDKCAAVDDVVINTLIKRGEVQAKLAKINAALEKDPENIKLLIKHAETYLDNSFVTELSYQPHVITYALADYKKVLELDPEDKNNVAQHIHFFEAWGKWGATRHQEFKDFYEKYPNSIRKPFAAYTLYYDANAEGDIETALKYLREIEKAKLDSEFGRSILETIEQLQKIVDRRAAKKPGTIGSVATKLTGLQWVKGDAVEMKEGSTYVIEFWATWCGPCIAGIPHLTELQHSYKDKKVTVIGISREKIDTVRPFVEKRGDQMGYTVAIDTTGDINKAYMKAFGQSGIPHAFIVDQKGQIAWHGHPMEMDDILEQVAAGDFDGIAHEKQKAEEAAKAEQDYKDNLAALEKKLADNDNDVDLLITYGKLLRQRRESTEKGTEVILKAIKLDAQKCAEVNDPVINNYIQRVEIEENVAKINSALENDPENIKLLIKRAEAYLGDNCVTEISYQPRTLTYALADYKKVLELDPKDKNNVAEHIQFFEAWRQRGSGHYNEFEDFCEKYPNSIRKPFAMYLLYHNATKKGDIETALKYLREIEKAKLDSDFGKKIAETAEQFQKMVDRQAAKKAGTVGSAAADLYDLKWVKGNPVKFEKGSVYVVEFWATWCGPCIAGIPHLTELQHKYKDKNVTVIGISAETFEKVKPFVDKQGDKMAYTVAIDSKRAMSKAYMEAFGQGGIPHAFIVDKEGKIAWHGHPMRMDDVLEEVINGTFDAEAYAKKLAEEKEKMARIRKNFTGYFKASGDQAKEIGKEILKDGNSQILNAFAWQILTEVKEEVRDVKLALRAAKKANRLDKGNNPAVLDTFALAMYQTGNTKKAFELQTKAVKLSKDNERMQTELKQTLNKYSQALKKDADQ